MTCRVAPRSDRCRVWKNSRSALGHALSLLGPRFPHLCKGISIGIACGHHNVDGMGCCGLLLPSSHPGGPLTPSLAPRAGSASPAQHPNGGLPRRRHLHRETHVVTPPAATLSLFCRSPRADGSARLCLLCCGRRRGRAVCPC